ncbi:reverse transcriptase (RNA-dependent DNA polymerase) [Hirsutella rhossiliensis]|uniref:Reverse transcriptase (RNA-dependent DNA polymerase) domain-containing protein n=1 Tax=Hirsutella rhossiliensis TaxID=111463 RepID=A0A9P8SMM3_9HYPO|nr:reverse transcriptase (RNA-dependent DNA polymerase) domain-containing protein [Hirsutella rhossiliensis]KAH0968748.1 reverse transcriptase (RNA-dependent DNA polymerase) domain-containing protein [Hirsutella rhossiliensis]
MLVQSNKITAMDFAKLGFKTVPQEPCVMIKGAVIVFFYVDDIILAYRKRDQQVATEAISGLQQRYKMSILGEPKWFLGIRILRHRLSRTIWLTQDAYIDKIAMKSSQGYVMTLFGGSVAWRASKQATVATSSTEAELLALSEASKEAIFLSRLLRSYKKEVRSCQPGYGMLIHTNTGYVRKCKEAEYALVGFQQLKCEPMEIGERLKLEARLEELKDKIKDCRNTE